MLLGYKSGVPVLYGMELKIVAENDQYDYHFDILMLGLVAITSRTMR